MNDDKLRKWAEQIELMSDDKLREPTSSLHQRKIKEIQNLVIQAKTKPSSEVYRKLKHVTLIPCYGASLYVSKCRDLQNSVNEIRRESLLERILDWLNGIQRYEGLEDAK